MHCLEPSGEKVPAEHSVQSVHAESHEEPSGFAENLPAAHT